MTHQVVTSTNSVPLVVCWSPKGGTGTSVFAATLAICLARTIDTVLVDAAGDQHAIFGVKAPEVGFVRWAESGHSVPADALSRLVIQVAPSLRLVPGGAGALSRVDASLVERIREAFPASCVVVDAGTLRSTNDGLATVVNDDARSIAVLRPCYLSANRALQCDIRRDVSVVVDEPGRVLTVKDIREVVGGTVMTLPFDPALARVVDAGRIARRLPRSTKSVEKFATELIEGEVARAS